MGQRTFPSSSSLIGLPNELLLAVCDCFALDIDPLNENWESEITLWNESGFTPLLRLSSTCHKFRSLILPLAFQHLSLPLDRDDLPKFCSAVKGEGQLRPETGSILSDMRENVRSLYVCLEVSDSQAQVQMIEDITGRFPHLELAFINYRPGIGRYPEGPAQLEQVRRVMPLKRSGLGRLKHLALNGYRAHFATGKEPSALIQELIDTHAQTLQSLWLKMPVSVVIPSTVRTVLLCGDLAMDLISFGQRRGDTPPNASHLAHLELLRTAISHFLWLRVLAPVAATLKSLRLNKCNFGTEEYSAFGEFNETLWGGDDYSDRDKNESNSPSILRFDSLEELRIQDFGAMESREPNAPLFGNSCFLHAFKRAPKLSRIKLEVLSYPSFPNDYSDSTFRGCIPFAKRLMEFVEKKQQQSDLEKNNNRGLRLLTIAFINSLQAEFDEDGMDDLSVELRSIQIFMKLFGAEMQAWVREEDRNSENNNQRSLL